MSETLSTSAASAPRPEPTCAASIAPTALPRMPSIGPEAARASSGRALPRACTDPSAMGSTSTFQTSVVPTIHSARLQAAVAVTPEGKVVVSSSQWSASRSASATASFCRWLGEGSGCCATSLRAVSSAKSQFRAPSYGCINDWIWLKRAPRSGMPPGPPPSREPPSPGTAEELLEGRALEGVLAAVVRVVGGVTGVVAHGSTVRVGGKVVGGGLGSDP